MQQKEISKWEQIARKKILNANLPKWLFSVSAGTFIQNMYIYPNNKKGLFLHLKSPTVGLFWDIKGALICTNQLCGICILLC